MSRKKNKFQGKLAEPMPPLRIGVLTSPEDTQTAIDNHTRLEFEKLGMLSDLYNVERSDFPGLALALAREFVPGFQEAPPKGRPKKWSTAVLGCLYVETIRKIELLGLENGDIALATEALAKQAHWSEFVDRVEAYGIFSNAKEVLRKAFYKAKKDRFSKVAMHAYYFHVETDTILEWDKFVKETILEKSE